MFWKTNSLRDAGDLPGDGERAPGSASGIGGVKLGRSGLGGTASGGTNGRPVLTAAMARSGDGPDGGRQAGAKSGVNGDFGRESGQQARPETGPQTGPGTGQSGEETGETAQPSAENGVPEDMATLVLDNSALGAGRAASVDAVAGVRAELDPASDAAVMLRVAAGDETAFNFLIVKHHRPVIHFLYRMTRNQAVAEELAQEVFLRVYRARDSYRAEAKFSTWLYRIATNLAVNHARDTKHERTAQTVYLDAPDEETGTTPDVADDEPSAEQRLMTNERMAAIRKHVMALPERQRTAVLMHKYQGMDYRQIGEVLKLSESATKSLLFRAYQTLRETLKDFV
jgi:RNA polymerase sigma-70 factor (ECF subfamily)